MDTTNHIAHQLLKLPFYISNGAEHSMEQAVEQYIEIKMHHLIKEGNYTEILVIGEYDRENSFISSHEKNSKKENWQRPTAMLQNDTLIVKVLPGRGYVEHYAILIASYLAIHKFKDPKIVKYVLPSEEECWKPIINSDLPKITPTKYVIIGKWLSEMFGEDDWRDHGTFYEKKKKFGKELVTLIRYKHSFWGDISARITKQLALNGFEHMIFTAKLGGIHPDLIPNVHLATGSQGRVNGEVIHWDNLFQDVKDRYLFRGNHLHNNSVITETKGWLAGLKAHDFVDSEVSIMGQAAVRNGMKYSYLHIVSNNLSVVQDENLSNERDPHILEKRKKQMDRIRLHLTSVLSN